MKQQKHFSNWKYVVRLNVENLTPLQAKRLLRRIRLGEQAARRLTGEHIGLLGSVAIQFVTEKLMARAEEEG